MRRFVFFVALLVVLLGAFSRSNASDSFWDLNGNALGAGPGTVNGNWNAADPNWNLTPDGTGTPAPWVSGDIAHFSADSDLTNTTVTLTGVQTAGGVIVEEGVVVLSTALAANNVNVGLGTVTVKTGAVLSVDNDAGSFEIVHTTAGGGLVLDGGTIRNTDTAAGDVFYSANANLTISAAAGIGYFDVTNPNNSGSIYTPLGTNGIKGEGGTINNGGAGTLYKKGAGELRIGTAGNNTFKFLVVEGTGINSTAVSTATANSGEYRLGNALDENTWGAIPLAPLANAITLKNGGMIGITAVTTGGAAVSSLHPNRGVVIDTGGGGSWGSGSGILLITGPLSGSGTLLSTGPASGGFGLNGSTAGFTGNVMLRTGFLILNQDLTTPNFSGTSWSSALFGTANIAPGKILTVGSDDASTTFDGRVTGSGGTFTKNGTGTLTMSTVGAGEWTNLGTVNINGGSIKYGNGLAGFGSYTTIDIASGASFDMNGIQDTYGGLNGPGNVINHNAAVNVLTQNSSNLNLRGSGTYNLSGTIDGSGLVIKNGNGTQTFSAPTGNTYGGGTSVIAGKLYVTNTSGSGTGGGSVSVTTNTAALTNGNVLDSGGTLGGTGFIGGPIAIGVGGHITGGFGAAPSNAVLTADSTVDLQSGGSIDANLGAPGNSDRLKVVNANALTVNPGGLLTLNGASSGITGPYTVFEHNGYALGSLADLHVNNATGFEMTGVVTDSGTTYDVTMNSTVQDRTWTADGDGNWSANIVADGANWDDGSQVNGPGAKAHLAPTTTSGQNHTITIADSDKTLGELHFEDGTGGTYTIAASGSRRLIMDTYGSGNATINVVSGTTHVISAPMTLNKNTIINNNGNPFQITGGLYNKAGLVNNGAGTLAITSGAATQQIVNNADLVNSGTGDLTITMSGAGGFVNNATGRVLNSLSGNLTLTNNGSGNTSLINNGTIENAGSGTLTINGAIGLTGAVITTDTVQTATVVGKFVNSGGGIYNITVGMASADGLSFTNSLAGTMTISGVITGAPGLSDAGNIYIEGPGTVIINNASNAHYGRKILKSGKLQISSDASGAEANAQLGKTPRVGGGAYDDITFDGGTLLTTNATGNLTINAGRGIFMKSSGTIEATTVGNTVFGGRIHGTGTLTKDGPSQLNLTGENITFDGNILVAKGILNATTEKSLGTTIGSTTVIDTGTLQVGGVITYADALIISGTGAGGIGAINKTGNNATTLTGGITLAAAATITNNNASSASNLIINTGTLALGANNLTFGGVGFGDEPININSPSTFSGTRRIDNNGGTVFFDGGLTGSSSPNLTIGGDGRTEFKTLPLNIASGTLTKEGGAGGASTLLLSTANTIGAVTWTSGRIVYSATGAFGSGVVTVGPGATALSASGSLGTLTVGNTIALNSGAAPILSPATSTTLDLTGPISGLGSLIRGRQSGTGAGVGMISGTNSYSGGFSHFSDGLILNNKAAAGTGGYTIGEVAAAPAGAINVSAFQDLSGANAITNPLTINRNFTVSGTNNLEYSGLTTLATSSPIITVTNTAATTLSGNISGTGFGISKAGNQALTLKGANSYDGGTIIDDGSLVLSGAAATLGSGSVTVNGLNVGSSLSILSGVANAISNTAVLNLFGGGTAGVADQGFALLGGGINEAVGALFLNGTMQLGGTYGSTASSATNQLDEYFSVLGTGIISVPVAGVEGDYNDNGFVDAADYVLWRRHDGETYQLDNEVTTPPTSPGVVMTDDYDAWRERFGNPGPGVGTGGSLSSGSAVPEPTTLALLMFGLSALAIRRRGC